MAEAPACYGTIDIKSETISKKYHFRYIGLIVHKEEVIKFDVINRTTVDYLFSLFMRRQKQDPCIRGSDWKLSKIRETIQALGSQPKQAILKLFSENKNLKKKKNQGLLGSKQDTSTQATPYKPMGHPK